MSRYLSILVFIGLVWGQDILITIDKKEFKGKLLEQSDKNTNFLPDGQKAPQKIPNKLKHKHNFVLAQSRYFNDISSFAVDERSWIFHYQAYRKYYLLCFG